MKKKPVIILLVIGMVTFVSAAVAQICGNGVCGDWNGDDNVNILDVTLCINFCTCHEVSLEYCNELGEIICWDNADSDCDNAIKCMDECDYLIDYLYRGGPAPCDPDDDGEPDC